MLNHCVWFLSCTLTDYGNLFCSRLEYWKYCVMAAPMQFPKFDPSKDNGPDYRVAVETYWTLVTNNAQKTPAIQLSTLQLNLDRSILKIVLENCHPNQPTLNDYFDYLKDAYPAEAPLTQFGLRSKLLACKQGSEKSVDELLSRFARFMLEE